MTSALSTLYQLQLPTRNATLEDAGLSRNIDLLPLVVDLDGTLTPTDTLAELVIELLKHSPLTLFMFPFWLLQGIAHFKARIAAQTRFSAATLPYRADVLQFLVEQKALGRMLVLATAAHESIARSVASHLGLFDHVMGSTATCNLKGKRKLAGIVQQVGEAFVYAGDSQADLPIWLAAHAAVLVNVPTSLAKSVKNNVLVEREFPVTRTRLKVWAKAIRVHQWVKNLLIFVPLITGFSFFNLASVVPVLLAFLAFSFAASATYIVNDLSDLNNDRAHARKRNRPFASCAISIASGIGAAMVLMISAFLIATQISTGFSVVLLTYVIITSAYTLRLKEYVLIDVLTLSVLYTIRIVAGAFAIGLTMSSWLLAFSVFMFLSLALVKRCSELMSLRASDLKSAKGRDYNTADLVILWPLGVGAALSSVVIFGLFISSSVTRERYATPEILWLVALGLIYWLGRLWIKTARGEMHDDPIVYALKNNGSRVTITICIAAMVVGHFFDFSPS
jgi:4-hydroxybenzoate polyprenyltransferase/phosphoserine phosphatase